MGLVESILQRLFPPIPEPTAQLRAGQVALLRGRVVPRDLITSPLSKTRCVYYQTLEETFSSSTSADSQSLWVTVGRDEAICEFYLQDGTDRVIVAPQNVKLDLGSQGLILVGRTAKRRQSEFCIRPDDEIEVQGIIELAEDLHDESRGYRDDSVRWLVGHPQGGQLTIRWISQARSRVP